MVGAAIAVDVAVVVANSGVVIDVAVVVVVLAGYLEKMFPGHLPFQSRLQEDYCLLPDLYPAGHP